MTNVKKFWSHVDRSDADACWVWRGGQYKGYGQYGNTAAHRVAFRLARGFVPTSPLELDHICRNTLCVNPSHLEPVTRLENMRRRYADYDACVNGHDYSPANTYIRPNGRRDCRTCIRDRANRYQARKAGRAS